MILEELFDIVSKFIRSTSDIDSILMKEEIKAIQSSEIVDTSDQEISEFIKRREKDEDKQKLIFDIVQKIKIEKSIDSITDDVEEEKTEEDKKQIYSLFGTILEPEDIRIEDDKLHLIYSYQDGSKMKNKVLNIEKWNRDNVIYTISKKMNVPTENIIVVDSVSSYIEFIDSFEESNYVSRGQKDCTFTLEPSLYRMYKDGYIGHSSQYESSFRQRVLYYDGSTEKKTMKNYEHMDSIMDCRQTIWILQKHI